MIVALALLTGALLGAPPPAPKPDAWPLLQRAAAQVAKLPDAPVLSFVRGGPHPPQLLDEELALSLEVLRDAEAALAPLDAALAGGGCVDPGDGGAEGLRALGDWVLALAVADARAGKPKLAAASMGRAADLAATLARCAPPTPQTLAVALGVAKHTRDLLFALSDDGLLPVESYARIAAALRPVSELPSGAPMTPEATALQDAARADQALLEEASAALLTQARSGAFPNNLPVADGKLSQGARWFALTPVRRVSAVIRCAPGPKPGTFVMTREVAEALGHRGPDAILQGSMIAPQLDGSVGLIVARAGPVARSCGLVDGDVVLEVNGVLLQRPEDALITAPAQVQRDRFARFRVRRAGDEQLIVVEHDRALATAAP